ncbi:MAG: hypothetical protein UIJ87_06985 [Anaerovoracaceae bacterium]|nr:hypothetical protein [Anaerovoracaceae bacterium]
MENRHISPCCIDGIPHLNGTTTLMCGKSIKNSMSIEPDSTGEFYMRLICGNNRRKLHFFPQIHASDKSLVENGI